LLTTLDDTTCYIEELLLFMTLDDFLYYIEELLTHSQELYFTLATLDCTGILPYYSDFSVLHTSKAYY